MSSFSLSTKAAHYLLLQRTQYQSPVPRFIRGRVLRNIYNRHLVGPFHLRRRKDIARLYFSEMAEKYRLMKPVLAERKVRRVLDIGAGLGGIDAIINDRLRRDGPIDFYLLDKDMVSPRIFYLFEQEGAAYNSFGLTHDFLCSNGLGAEFIHSIDIGRESFPTGLKFELVMSLISWGFHYPIDTYIEQVHEVLAPGGVLIMDVRRGTGGIEKLKTWFGPVRVLEEEMKYVKVAVEK